MTAAIGLFWDRASAEEALAALERAGFTRDEISLLAQEEVVEEFLDEDAEETAIDGAGAGALGGTALGGLVGLIAGASALVIPGVGPALAFGTWATVVGSPAAGAGIGAAYGGLVGALVGLGMAEEQTDVYVDGVQRGGILILVQPEDPDRLEVAEALMLDNDGAAIDLIEEPE